MCSDYIISGVFLHRIYGAFGWYILRQMSWSCMLWLWIGIWGKRISSPWPGYNIYIYITVNYTYTHGLLLEVGFLYFDSLHFMCTLEISRERKYKFYIFIILWVPYFLSLSFLFFSLKCTQNIEDPNPVTLWKWWKPCICFLCLNDVSSKM